MAIILNPGTYGESPAAWMAALRAELPEMEIWLWPEAPPPETVEFVVAMRHSPADLHRYRNLRAVLAMGAGVEQYTGPDMPDVPVVRLAEPYMSDEMAAYVVHWIVHFQKGMDTYLEQQRAATWRPVEYATARTYPVSILGFGNIGMRIGRALHDLGFPINAWSRSGTDAVWADSFAGADRLADCLGSSAAVVNVLPGTAETRRIMNAARFEQCRRGALFVNIGRGTTVDEAALLDALDTGRIGAAILDVADPEPMEATNPLWRHPRVRITPHVAGHTVVEPATKVIAANIRRIGSGEDPFPLIERSLGY